MALYSWYWVFLRRWRRERGNRAYLEMLKQLAGPATGRGGLAGLRPRPGPPPGPTARRATAEWQALKVGEGVYASPCASPTPPHTSGLSAQGDGP